MKKTLNKILMYHAIGESANPEIGAEVYSVSVENFRKQMEYLARITRVNSQWPIGDSQKNKNYRLSAIDNRPIMITFDDGLLDNYTTAYPILKEFGLKAYFFILVSKIGTPGFMTGQQLKELQDNAMIIGSHGLTHRILTELSEEELDYELRESKKILEGFLKSPVEHFSVPRGFYNQKVIDKAKEIGYTAVFTSGAKETDGFVLGRIPVKSTWGIGYFTQVLDTGLSFKDRLKESLKDSSKKLLGPKYYDRARNYFLQGKVKVIGITDATRGDSSDKNWR